LIDFKIYNTIEALPESWDALPVHDIFLKRSFLKGLEQSAPKNISSYYLGVFKNQKLIGIAIIQRVEMYLDDIFRNTSSNKLKQLAKRIISKIVRGNALIIGNLMHTGQHSLFFIKEEISYKDYLEIVFRALKALQKQIKKEYNKKVRIIGFKDYFETDEIHNNIDLFKTNNLYKVQVQPNMLFPIKKDWITPEDYISAFTKKYRKRYKTARKKSNAIVRKELNTEEIKNYGTELYKLYKTVSDNARVNSFILAENHFLSLKKELNNNFRVFGYFLNEELVGFYTLILNYNTLETYFLGYNKTLQHQHQMYLNMLYDMACFAIENKFKTIVYARTAMEIKSSVGAKPNTMHIYMKHTNNFIANTILKLIVKYLNPVKEWTERHPFN
jgi:hypothetical protein